MQKPLVKFTGLVYRGNLAETFLERLDAFFEKFNNLFFSILYDFA